MFMTMQDGKLGPFLKTCHWKMLEAAAFLFLSLSFAAGPASADEALRKDDLTESCKSRIFGIIEKAPLSNIGTWVVGRREVRVTRETRIIEKHGKAEIGAFVEVVGNNTGKIFSAYRIEVKRSKHR